MENKELKQIIVLILRYLFADGERNDYSLHQSEQLLLKKFLEDNKTVGK